MQGHKSSITTLPENLSFDHGSTSSEPVTDSQISGNNMPISTHNRLPRCIISPNEANLQYLHHLGCQSLNAEWSIGETSSTASHSQGENNERKLEPAWPMQSRLVLSLDVPHCQTPNIIPPDNNNNNNNIDLNSTSTQSRDLNMQAKFENPEHDTCQIIINSSDLASGSSEHIMGIEESGSACSVDGRRMSCKRKSLEVHGGESSGESSLRPMENKLGTNNKPEQMNSRLRIGECGSLLPEPFSYSARPESSRRNLRLRINTSHHQDHVPLNPSLLGPVGPDDPSSRTLPSISLRDRLLNLNPPPIVENGSFRGQTSLLDAPSTHRNTQSRWIGPSGLRTGSSSALGERDPMLYEEFGTRNTTRSVSEHPMFVPSSEIGSLPPQPGNWNVGSNSFAVGVGSSSWAGPALGVLNSSGPSLANRGRPQYLRRLSEIVRRSLLTSASIDLAGGGQSGSQALRSGPSQGVAISSRPGNHSRHMSGLAERQHVDGAYGLPYTFRSLPAGGEGRTSLMSETRHVLDLMRRGEGLRFEDVMILNHPLFFGMADIHDRHRDMRLDVDSMSYEELLALGERIGNVSTGLNEETIMSRLKQTTYVNRAEHQTETEPCTICREEYIDEENLGILECGHEFHRDCIKQWLVHKNLCPICKTTGLTK